MGPRSHFGLRLSYKVHGSCDRHPIVKSKAATCKYADVESIPHLAYLIVGCFIHNRMVKPYKGSKVKVT